MRIPTRILDEVMSMPWDLPLGNGSPLVAFDRSCQVRDPFWRHVGQDDHAGGLPFRLRSGRLASTAGWITAGLTEVCVGMATPAVQDHPRVTKPTWRVAARILRQVPDGAPVRLLTSVEAMAYAVPFVEPSELETLNEGQADANARGR